MFSGKTAAWYDGFFQEETGQAESHQQTGQYASGREACWTTAGIECDEEVFWCRETDTENSAGTDW